MMTCQDKGYVVDVGVEVKDLKSQMLEIIIMRIQVFIN